MAQAESSRHQAELRERVLRYALDEFLNKGVKNVKVDQIAADLQISKRTLYEMFADKENLLVECLRWHNKQLHEKNRKIAEGAANPLESYARIFNQKISELHEVNPAFFVEANRYESVRNIFHEEAHERSQNAMQFIDQCVREGLFRADVNYELVLRVLDLVGRTIMEHELYQEYGLDEIVRVIDITHLRGLCTPKGMAILDGANGE